MRNKTNINKLIIKNAELIKQDCVMYKELMLRLHETLEMTLSWKTKNIS